MYRIVAVLSSLLLLFCSASFAQNGTSQSSPRGLLKVFGEHVRVNGQTVSDVTTVFDGDRIETGSDSAVSLLQPGHILALNQNSSATFRNGSLVSAVNTTSGISPALATSNAAKPCTVSADKPGNGPKCKK